MYKLTGAAITDAGRFRENNEDNFVLLGAYKEDTSIQHLEVEREFDFLSGDELGVAVVFDGVGGVDNGEVASLIGARGIALNHRIDELADIKQQIISLNEDVCNDMIANNRRMAATVAAVYFKDGEAVSVNLGDSRCYLFRDNKLKLLSHDHSKGQYLIDEGQLSEAEAKNSHYWHVITQYLGSFPNENTIEPFFCGPFPIRSGDRFLICSDGLTDPLYDERLNEIMHDSMALGTPIMELARELLGEALDAGGKDNVTAVIVDVDGAFDDDKTVIIKN